MKILIFSHSKYTIFRKFPKSPDFSTHIYSKYVCSTLSTEMMFFKGALVTAVNPVISLRVCKSRRPSPSLSQLSWEVYSTTYFEIIVQLSILTKTRVVKAKI